MSTQDFINTVLAGIVTYNPDLGRLRENVDAVFRNGISRIVIVDNGSAAFGELSARFGADDRIRLIANGRNRGIACALNQIFEEASHEPGIEWVLTLDQDSVIFDELLDRFAGHAGEEGVVSLCALKEDRANHNPDEHSDAETEFVNGCYTSGNLVKLSAWREVGGFDSRLFIDMVDYDFCLRLLENGGKILRINQVLFLHSLGEQTPVRFLGKTRYLLNYSAFRRYYITRNTIYLRRSYALGNSFFPPAFLTRNLLKVLLFEQDKLPKLSASLQGLRDARGLRREDFRPWDAAASVEVEAWR